MRENVIRLTLCAMLIALCSSAHAQQPKKVSRIGVLSPGSSGPSPLLDAFRQGLRELGYVERQNIAIEYRFAEAKLERLSELAAELVRLKVDVIITINATASRAAKNVTMTIPIVFTWVADLLELVASLARPGANITGLTTIAWDLSGKRLELLKESVPGVSRVGVLWNSANPTATRVFREMEEASPRVGVRIHPMGVGDPDELQKAFEVATKERVGGLFVIEEAVMASYRTRVLGLASKYRLPTGSQYQLLQK